MQWVWDGHFVIEQNLKIFSLTWKIESTYVIFLLLHKLSTVLLCTVLLLHFKSYVPKSRNLIFETPHKYYEYQSTSKNNIFLIFTI